MLEPKCPKSAGLRAIDTFGAWANLTRNFFLYHSEIVLFYHLDLPGSETSTLISIFRQLCPRCRSARIFRSSLYWGFPKMNDRCPACGLHFDREPGYFLGAMYISYGLALAVIFVFSAALWWLTHMRVDKVAIWGVVLFLPFAPMLTFLSRVLWIYLDQTVDPEKK